MTPNSISLSLFNAVLQNCEEKERVRGQVTEFTNTVATGTLPNFSELHFLNILNGALLLDYFLKVLEDKKTLFTEL